MAARRAPKERHPDWEAPRLRRADPPSRSSTTSPLLRVAPQRSPANRAARRRLRPLARFITVCVLGIATGTGGAYLLVCWSPATAARVAAPGRSAVSAIASGADAAAQSGNGARLVAITVPLPPAPQAAAPQPRAAESGEPALSGSSAPGKSGAKPAPATIAQGLAMSGTASQPGDARSGLSALLARTERELAERKLEQPDGDNALQSYRQLAATWPRERRVLQLGGSLGLAFWSLGQQAQASGNWRSALHYFEIVNSLPPVPLAAVQAAPAARAE